MANVGTKILCGTTTLCGAGTIVGQGNFPELWALYTTDDASSTSPTWTDATAKVRQFSVSRGRDNELADFDAGTANIVVDNRDRTFDPTLHSSIRPMNRWWLREQFSGATEDMFLGYAESYDNQWPTPGGATDAVAVVDCVDEFKVLALRHLSTTDPPRDSYDDVVLSDDPTGYWTFSDETLGAAVGEQLQAVGSYTIASDSPIVGETPGSQNGLGGSISLTGLNYVETHPNAGGGAAGDAAGLTEFTVEAWWKTSGPTGASAREWITGPLGTPGNTTYIMRSTGSTGFINFLVANTVPTGYVAAAAIPAPLTGWHHIVGMLRGGFVRLFIDGVLLASTAFVGSIAAALPDSPFSIGFPTNTEPDNVNISKVAFYRYGLSDARVLAHYNAGALRGFATGSLAGARVTSVLDSISSPANRSISAGTAGRFMTGSYMTGQGPLDELRKAQQAENGDAMLFVASDGTITFLDGAHRSSSPYNTVQATFDDDGTDFAYHDLNVEYSEMFLANEWNVTRTLGLVQSVSDSTSISAYIKRPKSITDVPVTTDANALTIATALLAKYKDPQLRITSIVPKIADFATAASVFARDLGDRIRVFRTPPGGGARIDQTLFIQSIRIDGDASSPLWRVSWGVSPL